MRSVVEIGRGKTRSVALPTVRPLSSLRGRAPSWGQVVSSQRVLPRSPTVAVTGPRNGGESGTIGASAIPIGRGPAPDVAADGDLPAPTSAMEARVISPPRDNQVDALAAEGLLAAMSTSTFGLEVHGDQRGRRFVIRAQPPTLRYLEAQLTDDQLEELLLIALEGRQRIREQLHAIAPGEYFPVKIGARFASSGKEILPTLPEAGRRPRVTLPVRPLVGEVIGLAVAGEQGLILRFEMQATKGHGRIVPLGSIQRVMRESIEAAAQYIRAHYKELGIAADWRENFDVAVLATMMAIPKEGPSAGVTIATGIVSALKNIPVRHDIAMTGEITIMGKVLGVGGIQAKLLAAVEAGVKTVILPAENEQDVRYLPDYMQDRLHLVYVKDIQEALDAALVG